MAQCMAVALLGPSNLCRSVRGGRMGWGVQNGGGGWQIISRGNSSTKSKPPFQIQFCGSMGPCTSNFDNTGMSTTPHCGGLLNVPSLPEETDAA